MMLNMTNYWYIFYCLFVFLSIEVISLRVIRNNGFHYRRTTIKSEIRTVEWARSRGMEPGYGGIWPGNPNAKTYNVTILSNGTSYSAQVPSDRYIYFYFEELGIELPIINKNRMCRQGTSQISS